jgi:hypothetical protein
MVGKTTGERCRRSTTDGTYIYYVFILASQLAENKQYNIIWELFGLYVIYVMKWETIVVAVLSK